MNYQWLFELISSWALRTICSGVLLFLGLWLIGYLSRWTKKILDKNKIEPTLTPFIATVINLSLKVLLFISVAGLLGIQTTSFAAILVGVSVAIAGAFNGSLGNLASGVMLLIFRPFKVGDVIETNGAKGTVKEISVFVTVLLDAQNHTLIIPNAKITSDKIKNCSAEDFYRIDIGFSINYGADIEKVKKLVSDILEKDPYVMKDPSFSVGVEKLGEHYIEMIATPYAKSGDQGKVHRDTRQKIAEALTQEGFEPLYRKHMIKMIDTKT